MKHTVTLLILVFIASSGVSWLWGVAALFVWFFIEIVKFFFTPQK